MNSELQTKEAIINNENLSELLEEAKELEAKGEEE